MDSFYIPPGSVAAPTSGQPSVGAARPSNGSTPESPWSSTGSSPRPLLNVAKEWQHPVVAPAPHAPLSPTMAARKSRLVGLVAMAGVAVLIVAGGAYALLGHKQTPKSPSGTPKPAVAVSSPSVRPSASPSTSPSPTPTPTPSATPSATPSPSSTPAPQTVSQPTVTPTSSHPQSVTVKAASGLWLRSSPSSVNRSNIVGWMPDGATVSVDSTGDFWWHGTYQGKSGYFASSYTN